jgi:glycosyltransferase involved in cell wall biosynthesis
MERRILVLSEEQGHGGIHTLLGVLQTTLRAQGWVVHSVHVRKGRPGFLDLLQQARQAQVLVASNNFSPAYWAVLLGLLAQRPSVVWVHGPLSHVLQAQPVSWLKRQWMRWTCQMADLLVFASRTTQASLHEVFPPDQLPAQAVILNPAPHTHTDQPTTPVSSKGVALGFVGRLSAEKRPELLLQMLQHLPADHHLTLVGDGPLRGALEQKAAELGLLATPERAARVHFAGAQDVGASTYQAWQATLLCSAYEGYPMVALESLAAGVPCIGLRLPALQELLGPECAQWLAEDDSPQALARVLQKTLKTPVAQRREQALARARQHRTEDFGQQWHAQLLRCTRQTRPGPQSVHFVHTGTAYMPELSAYESHLSTLGHRCVRHADPATVPLDADIVWWMCGSVSAHHSHRLRRSLHVHEYASASVGRLPAVKDRLKRWRHPRPDHRVFLNEWVRQRMGFDDGVPCSLRDMGVPQAFLHAQSSAPIDHDLVYLGEMGRLRHFLPTLQAISQAGLRLLLVGQVPADLEGILRLTPGLQCTGRIPQAEVAAQLLRARAGLNLMPDRLPLSQQTSTKVLEYLAVGLPVLSNDYAWARRAAEQYPGRVQLLKDTQLPPVWTQALAQLPERQSERSSLQTLAWSARLAELPLWTQLGLSGDPL